MIYNIISYPNIYITYERTTNPPPSYSETLDSPLDSAGIQIDPGFVKQH